MVFQVFTPMYSVLPVSRNKANCRLPLWVHVLPRMTTRHLTGYLEMFYGGAFAAGDGASYDGNAFIQRSVELGEPVIHASFNYRLNAFGWLGGKEALAGGAANVGLHDRECRLD